MTLSKPTNENKKTPTPSSFGRVQLTDATVAEFSRTAILPNLDSRPTSLGGPGILSPGGLYDLPEHLKVNPKNAQEIGNAAREKTLLRRKTMPPWLDAGQRPYIQYAAPHQDQHTISKDSNKEPDVSFKDFSRSSKSLQKEVKFPLIPDSRKQPTADGNSDKAYYQKASVEKNISKSKTHGRQSSVTLDFPASTMGIKDRKAMLFSEPPNTIKSSNNQSSKNNITSTSKNHKNSVSGKPTDTAYEKELPPLPFQDPPVTSPPVVVPRKKMTSKPRPKSGINFYSKRMYESYMSQNSNPEPIPNDISFITNVLANEVKGSPIINSLDLHKPQFKPFFGKKITISSQKDRFSEQFSKIITSDSAKQYGKNQKEIESGSARELLALNGQKSKFFDEQEMPQVELEKRATSRHLQATISEMESYTIAKRIYLQKCKLIKQVDYVSWMGTDLPNQNMVRKAYMDLFNFSNASIMLGLRRVCENVFMKAESQQLDRIMNEYSERWIECNPNHGFKNVSVVYTIAYSILLLNTDHHSNQKSQRMTKSQYINFALEAIENSVRDIKNKHIAPKLRRKQLVPSISYFDKPKTKYPLVDDSSDYPLSQWKQIIQSILKNIYVSMEVAPLPLALKYVGKRLPTTKVSNRHSWIGPTSEWSDYDYSDAVAKNKVEADRESEKIDDDNNEAVGSNTIGFAAALRSSMKRQENEKKELNEENQIRRTLMSQSESNSLTSLLESPENSLEAGLTQSKYDLTQVPSHNVRDRRYSSIETVYKKPQFHRSISMIGSSFSNFENLPAIPRLEGPKKYNSDATIPDSHQPSFFDSFFSTENNSLANTGNQTLLHKRSTSMQDLASSLLSSNNKDKISHDPSSQGWDNKDNSSNIDANVESSHYDDSTTFGFNNQKAPQFRDSLSITRSLKNVPKSTINTPSANQRDSFTSTQKKQNPSQAVNSGLMPQSLFMKNKLASIEEGNQFIFNKGSLDAGQTGENLIFETGNSNPLPSYQYSCSDNHKKIDPSTSNATELLHPDEKPLPFVQSSVSQEYAPIPIPRQSSSLESKEKELSNAKKKNRYSMGFFDEFSFHSPKSVTLDSKKAPMKTNYSVSSTRSTPKAVTQTSKYVSKHTDSSLESLETHQKYNSMSRKYPDVNETESHKLNDFVILEEPSVPQDSFHWQNLQTQQNVKQVIDQSINQPVQRVTSSLRRRSIPDAELPLYGSPWAKEGLLQVQVIREIDSLDKNGEYVDLQIDWAALSDNSRFSKGHKNRNLQKYFDDASVSGLGISQLGYGKDEEWTSVFVVVQQGYLKMFKFDKETSVNSSSSQSNLLRETSANPKSKLFGFMKKKQQIEKVKSTDFEKISISSRGSVSPMLSRSGSRSRKLTPSNSGSMISNSSKFSKESKAQTTKLVGSGNWLENAIMTDSVSLCNAYANIVYIGNEKNDIMGVIPEINTLPWATSASSTSVITPPLPQVHTSSKLKKGFTSIANFTTGNGGPTSNSVMTNPAQYMASANTVATYSHSLYGTQKHTEPVIRLNGGATGKSVVSRDGRRFILVLPNKTILLFLAGTQEIAEEFTYACNYWAARVSKEPLYEPVSSNEYGWDRPIEELCELYNTEEKEQSLEEVSEQKRLSRNSVSYESRTDDYQHYLKNIRMPFKGQMSRNDTSVRSIYSDGSYYTCNEIAYPKTPNSKETFYDTVEDPKDFDLLFSLKSLEPLHQGVSSTQSSLGSVLSSNSPITGISSLNTTPTTPTIPLSAATTLDTKPLVSHTYMSKPEIVAKSQYELTKLFNRARLLKSIQHEFVTMKLKGEIGPIQIDDPINELTALPLSKIQQLDHVVTDAVNRFEKLGISQQPLSLATKAGLIAAASFAKFSATKYTPLNYQPAFYDPKMHQMTEQIKTQQMANGVVTLKDGKVVCFFHNGTTDFMYLNGHRLVINRWKESMPSLVMPKTDEDAQLTILLKHQNALHEAFERHVEKRVLMEKMCRVTAQNQSQTTSAFKLKSKLNKTKNRYTETLNKDDLVVNELGFAMEMGKPLSDCESTNTLPPAIIPSIMHNWELRANYLLKEIMKYDIYTETLRLGKIGKEALKDKM